MPNRAKGQDVPATLTDPEFHQVCRWMGEFRSSTQVQTLIKQTFGKQVSPHYALEVAKRHKWGLLIDRYRQEWLSKIYDIPLANKKVRLAKLQWLMEHLDKQELTPRTERRIMHVLNQARLEMEEKPDQTTFFFTNINQLGDEELLKRRAELLALRSGFFDWWLRQWAKAEGTRDQAIQLLHVGAAMHLKDGEQLVVMDPAAHGH